MTLHTIYFPNNLKIDRMELFQGKEDFRVNFFVNEKYAGRITDSGEYPEDYLIIRENLTSIARRMEDSFLHKSKNHVATLHENHYNPKEDKKIYNPKDLAIYHPNNKQHTPDGKFWYHVHLDINTKINHQSVNFILNDLWQHNIISENELSKAQKEIINTFSDEINFNSNEVIKKHTAHTSTSSQILDLNSDERSVSDALFAIKSNNSMFEKLAAENAKYSPTPAKSFSLPKNIADEEKKAISFYLGGVKV
jgi:hypothetical protein